MISHRDLTTTNQSIIMPVIYVNDDILSGNYDMIAHQCNCVTRYGKGLYSDIAKKYPQAHIYPSRQFPSVPGTIVVTEPVIGIMSQFYPGRANDSDDTSDMRLKWFREGLKQIAELELGTVAFPFGIGCGLAKGDWKAYEKIIKEFEKSRSSAKAVVLPVDGTLALSLTPGCVSVVYIVKKC